jgi:phosphoglycerate dehydrogenase-like enzyme
MTNGLRLPVVIAAHLDPAARSLITQELAGERLHWVNKPAPTAADRSAVASAEVVFGNVPADWLAEAQGLRWLQLESIGCEYYASTTLPTGLVITNLAGQFAAPAVETALAGLLGLLRGLPDLMQAKCDRRWIELELRPRTGIIQGRSCLVLGTGSIEREYAFTSDAVYRCLPKPVRCPTDARIVACP